MDEKTRMAKDCCQVEVEEDGLILEPGTVAGEEIDSIWNPQKGWGKRN